MRAIDKLDRLGLGGVRALLGEGRKDGSGDFTEGAGLSDEAQAEIVMGFMEAKRETGPAETVARLYGAGSRGLRPVRPACNELGNHGAMLLDAGKGTAADRIEIDPSVVRGLGYYTGPVSTRPN